MENTNVIPIFENIYFSQPQFVENKLNVDKFLPISNLAIAIKDCEYYLPPPSLGYYFDKFSVEIELKYSKNQPINQNFDIDLNLKSNLEQCKEQQICVLKNQKCSLILGMSTNIQEF